MAFRGFIAVEVGPLPSLLPLLEALRESGADLKVVAPENLHLTLKFLGDVPDGKVPALVEAVRGATRDVGSFTMRLRGMGTFPSRGAPRVVWAGIEGADALTDVAERLDRDLLPPLGWEPEGRRFSPHVTLARARSPRGKDRVIPLVQEHREDDLGEVRVGDVRLMRSALSPRGPTYSVVEAVPLGGA